jgi:hypothetical protein
MEQLPVQLPVTDSFYQTLSQSYCLTSKFYFICHQPQKQAHYCPIHESFLAAKIMMQTLSETLIVA